MVVVVVAAPEVPEVVPLVPEVVPEVVPDVVPEVVPEVVPDVVPDVVPEVVPEVVDVVPEVLVVLVPEVVVVVSDFGFGLGRSLGTCPTEASSGALTSPSGTEISSAARGAAAGPSSSVPRVARPTANDPPSRTTAATASASRVRPGLTHSPSCAAGWSPVSCSGRSA